MVLPMQPARRRRNFGDFHCVYTEFSSFQNQIQVHVDNDAGNISSADYLIEAWKLLRHLYEVKYSKIIDIYILHI